MTDAPGASAAGLDVLIARWRLDELPPEDVPTLACTALEQGCGSPTVASLAGLRPERRADIEEHLPRLLHETRRTMPTEDEAGKVLVDDWARRTANGEVHPEQGGRALWRLSHQWYEQAGVWDQLSIFVGLTSEWEDHPEHQSAYESELVAEAQALVDRGGLTLPPGPGRT